MLKTSKYKNFLLTVFLITLFFLGKESFLTTVFAENLDINFTVPAICGNGVVEGSEQCDDGNTKNGDGCSSSCQKEGSPPDCTGDCEAPRISFISVVPGSTTAVIKWNATDNVAVVSTTLGYGINNYVTKVAGELVGENYQVSLSGLAEDTTYTFQITAKDAKPNSATPYIGSFTTLVDSLPFISNVVTSTSYTTAGVSWTATDTEGVSSVSFAYGLNGVYGPVEFLTVSPNNNYAKSLVGLVMNSNYSFKITVKDTANQEVEYIGTFKTSFEDTDAPIISNIQAVPGVTTAQITWQTNEPANSRVEYGTSTSYGSIASSVNFVSNHNLLLPGLLPYRLYNFKVFSTDSAGNQASSNNLTFTTLKDSTAPSNVSNLTISIVNNSGFQLTWTNPALTGDNFDFVGVKILRKIGSYSINLSDGIEVYTGSGTSFTDNNVSKNINYYYTAFSHDTSGNYSSGVSVNSLIPPSVVPQVSNFNLEVVNGTMKLTWTNPGSSNFSGVKILRKTSNQSASPTDGQEVYSGSGQQHMDENIVANTKYYYTIFSYNSQGDYSSGVWQSGEWVVIPPNCFNDCSLPGCCSDPVCKEASVCQPGTQQEICNDGIDNDGDGLVDCNDPDCVGFSDCLVTEDEDSEPPIGTISEIEKITFNDLIFRTANQKILLSPVNGKITGLAGASLTVGLKKSALASEPLSLSLRLLQANNLFTLNNTDQIYYSNISFPGVSELTSYLEIDYGEEIGIDVFSFKITSLAYGSVTGEKNIQLSGVVISLFDSNKQLVSMETFGQTNPWTTNVNGIYGWMVPNGKYYLQVTREEYNERITPFFTVSNNVINTNISLIKKVKKLEEVIDLNASLQENVVNVVKNLTDKVGEIGAITKQAVIDITDNPEVEKVTKQIVAPAAVSAVAISTFSFISWANLLPFLRLLFLQPLLLLGYRKREKWGQVYNALNKLPVDLAIVRLLNAITGQVVQTKVTDKQGRYAFIVEPGKYKIEVQKSNLIFPSLLLSGYKDDGRRPDIYHGELIEVTESDSIITVNIPLDASGAENKKPTRLLWQRIGRISQATIAGLGFVITLVSFYIAPSWFIGALLVVHIVFGLLFRRLSKPVKTRGWGIVYDVDNKKPVGKTVARLFNAELNKLVASQVTDRKGRYYFLAGDNKYYVTFEHGNYNSAKSEVIDLSNKEADAVALDIGLKKSSKINKKDQPILPSKTEDKTQQNISKTVTPKTDDQSPIKEDEESIFG